MAVIVVMTPGWELQLERHVAVTMDKLADAIAADARRFAPVGTTGHLKSSIRVHKIGPTWRRVHAHAPYAAFVELGTGPHIIHPNSKKALHWPTARHPVKVVRHRGTPAYRYLSGALLVRRIL